MGLDEFCEQVLRSLSIDTASHFRPDDSLYETIGLDSFQALHLIVIVELLAGADGPAVELPGIYTLRDAYSYYVTLCDADPAATPA